MQPKTRYALHASCVGVASAARALKLHLPPRGHDLEPRTGRTPLPDTLIRRCQKTLVSSTLRPGLMPRFRFERNDCPNSADRALRGNHGIGAIVVVYITSARGGGCARELPASRATTWHHHVVDRSQFHAELVDMHYPHWVIFPGLTLGLDPLPAVFRRQLQRTVPRRLASEPVGGR